MALISSIDGPNRRIYLDLDSTLSPLEPMDIYKEMRTLRRTNEALRPYDPFLSGNGYEPKGGGKFTPRFVKCLLGTRIVPYDANHTLEVVGEIITDENTSGIACFDKTLLTPGVLVDIDYQPPQVEIIERTSGSGLSAEQDQKLTDIDNRTAYQIKIIDNKRILVKEIGVWHLKVFDDNGTTEILDKVLKDVNGDNITDLAAGVLAQEMATIV